MYTIDRIEDDVVVLEDRSDKSFLEVNINIFDFEVKEGDILDFIDNKYVKNLETTNIIKKDIRSRFDRLKK